MRKLVPASLLCCLLPLLVTAAPALAKKTTITVWHPLAGGEIGANLRAMVAQFEKTNPGIAVELVQSDVDGEKFLTTMAAGAPPDVIFPDGPDVVQWSYKGLLTPLDTRIKMAKLSTSTFFAPAYNQCIWQGKAYAMPWIADPNFPIIYRRSVFNEVGLAAAPSSFEEMELFAAKLNKVDANGTYKRVGLLPWDFYGPGNTLFSLGTAFGGSLYDDKARKLTLNSPKVVKAINWLQSFGQRYDYAKAEKLRTNFGAANPLISGKLGMGPSVPAILRDIDKAKLTMADFGWGFFNGPADGELKSAWLGGWTAAIPANAKHQDEAFKFIKWFCYDQAGADLTYKATGFFSASKRAAIYSDPDARTRPWVEVMAVANSHRPVMPAVPTLETEATRIMPLIMAGKKTPAQALDEANAVVQKELDRVLKRAR